MKSIKEKKERSLGIKLFIKAERCNSPKCVTVRRPHRPGAHGHKKPRSLSEYGQELHEKQKLQLTYGLNNKQMMNLFKKLPKDKVMKTLERRLDRVVFLLNLAKSPRIARQMVSHGHILVNFKRVMAPSYSVRVNDVIEIRAESQKSKMFEDLRDSLKKYNPPDWLEINKENLKGKCLKLPETDVYAIPFNIDLVNEFYSR